jgi:hypothetical protein
VVWNHCDTISVWLKVMFTAWIPFRKCPIPESGVIQYKQIRR